MVSIEYRSFLVYLGKFGSIFLYWPIAPNLVLLSLSGSWKWKKCLLKIWGHAKTLGLVDKFVKLKLNCVVFKSGHNKFQCYSSLLYWHLPIGSNECSEQSSLYGHTSSDSKVSRKVFIHTLCGAAAGSRRVICSSVGPGPGRWPAPAQVLWMSHLLHNHWPPHSRIYNRHAWDNTLVAKITNFSASRKYLLFIIFVLSN